MKFFKSIDEMSIKQKAILGTIKMFSAVGAITCAYAWFLLLFGFNFMLISLAAFLTFVVIKVLYEYNVNEIERQELAKNLKKMREELKTVI